MEGPHRQLCPRLPNRLRGDDPDGCAMTNQLASRQISPIAHATKAASCLAEQGRAHPYCRNLAYEVRDYFLCQHGSLFQAKRWKWLRQRATIQTAAHIYQPEVSAFFVADQQTFLSATILLGNQNLLTYFNKLAC